MGRPGVEGGFQRPRGWRRWLPFGATAAVAVWATAGLVVAAPPAPLLIRTADGVSVVAAETAETLASGVAASGDGSVVVSSRSLPGGVTRVEAKEVADGQTRWIADVPGDVAVALVSRRGDRAVLSEAAEQGLYAPAPRARTRLVVAGAGGVDDFDLAGNFAPEAMSSDGASVFLVQFRPALAPATYQVRRLDTSTGEVVDVYTPDAELQQEMGGTARTQVASADGRRLYTLYTLESTSGGTRAFVHVLDLEGLWAHCVDLPPGFTADPGTSAIAVAPSGERLFAVDSAAGLVAEIDTAALKVLRSVAVPRLASRGPTSAAAAADGTLFVASDGPWIVVLDSGSLRWARTFPAPDAVVALQAGAGRTVNVALQQRVVAIDAGSGEVVASYPVGAPVTGLGVDPPPLPEEQDKLTCAC